jgi:hypothetical protein
MIPARDLDMVVCGTGRRLQSMEKGKRMMALRTTVLLLLSLPAFAATWSPPKPGFVIHFDFISTAREGRELVNIAARAGAKVVNVVPPAHIWESRQALEMLDGILDQIKQNHLSLVFTRIDAAFPPDSKGERFYYLYSKILDERGILPNGKPTLDYFKTTAGRDGYAEWMEEETRYYAQRYGGLPNLLGINLGPFSEPFSSERGGFLEYMKETGRYEITQYTRYALDLWRRWLKAHYGNLEAVNAEYATSFASLDGVPMPLNESDSRFGKPELAYFDFARSLNDWFVQCYQRCRRIWHESGGRAEIPFILQFSGCEPEKFVNGRPGFSAFDMPGWVAMADALGLSLYTNNGYRDMAHATVNATINLVSAGRLLGKDVFVLEGGNEAPNVTLDPIELRYFGTVARSLDPRTYIYEFFKEKFQEDYRYNPGKIVTIKGKIRWPAFNALRALFITIENTPVAPVKPVLYAVSDSMAARGNDRAGSMNLALYDLAGTLPITWIPSGNTPVLEPGIPILQPDGKVIPGNENLSRLFRNIPPMGSPERIDWRQEVARALGR